MEQKLPSVSDVAKADDIKLQEITENAEGSTENLIKQLKGESSKDSVGRMHRARKVQARRNLRQSRIRQ